MQYAAVAISSVLLLSGGALAQDGPPRGVAPQPPSLSESAPIPRFETRVSPSQFVTIAAGAVAGVVAANFMTGGMLSPILLYGSGTALPSAAAASPGFIVAMVAIEAAWAAVDLLIIAAAPTAAASVAGPVHEALSDGYTTPETLLGAVGESIDAAETAAVDIGTYVRTAVGDWWYGTTTAEY
jgi:hypothetical protein